METLKSGQSGHASIPRPARAAGPASLRRVSGEGDVELTPRLRIVGPGRRERQYIANVERLEREALKKDSALEAATLVERGTERYVDRLEHERVADRERLQEVQAQGNRLLVAMGAMQKENERLVGELQRANGRIAAAHTPGVLGRLRRMLR
ncbi:MAG TPA: hypothetical protein QF446_10400 [Planctomycetota bacterium]|nr:hypothetical protein [Planctomycetota bacterium]